jgi:integrase/recombinase XerD
MNKFEQFLKERKYLVGCSERTLQWHEQSLKWLGIESPTASDLKMLVVRMKETGMSNITVNTYARSINSYLHWAAEPDAKCGPSCKHLKIAKLKEPVVALPLYPTDAIKKLLAHKPKDDGERRTWTLLLLMADTGCRITELLSLKWPDVNMNDCLITVRGKGDKTRTVPFSLEMRRILVKMKQTHTLVFPTRKGTQILRCNILRYVKRLCRSIGIEPPRRTLHAMRHTFSTNYLRKGGSSFHLMKTLGHTDTTMTKRYEHLLTDDLRAVHTSCSLLASA